MAALDLGRQGRHRLLAEWLADDLQTYGQPVGIKPARHRRDRRYASYVSPQPTSNTPAHFVQRMLRGPFGSGARA